MDEESFIGWPLMGRIGLCHATDDSNTRLLFLSFYPQFMDVKISEKNCFFLFFYSHREDKGYNISTPFFFERGLSRSIIRVVTGSFAPLTNPHTTSPKKMTSCLVSSRPSADDFTFVCNCFERVPLDFRNEFSGPFFVSL